MSSRVAELLRPALAPRITFINAVAYKSVYWQKGSKSFQLTLDTNNKLEGWASYAVETSLELSRVPEEYYQFGDVFSKQWAKQLPEHWSYDLLITTIDETLLQPGPIYSLSPLELQTLYNFIDKNLKTSIIHSPWFPCGTPVLFVKKKDGSLRLCVDYWNLNKLMHKDYYSILLVTNLLDMSKKVQIYTKIDLQNAYHLVCIVDGNKWKTVFHTRYGSFKWLVMPFGLCNVPSVFQCLMNDIFSDLLDIWVVIYLDNILIYSDNLAEHQKHVKEVLLCLQANDLHVLLNKCLFH